MTISPVLLPLVSRGIANRVIATEVRFLTSSKETTVLSLCVVTPGKRSIATRWTRRVLPPEARVSYASVGSSGKDIVLLYRLGGHPFVMTLSVEDGTVKAWPTALPPSVTRVEAMRVGYLLVSASSVEFTSVLPPKPQTVDAGPVTSETLERSTYDYAFGSDRRFLYHVRSEGYLDISQGELDVFQVLDRRVQRIARIEYDRGPFSIGVSRRTMLVLADDGRLDSYDLSSPRSPRRTHVGSTRDQWRSVWADPYDDIYYAIHDAGLQPFRMTPSGRLQSTSKPIAIRFANELRPFTTRKVFALFDDVGGVQLFRKTQKGSLFFLERRKLADTMCWPI